MSSELIRKYTDIINEGGRYPNDEDDQDGPGMLDQPQMDEVNEQLQELEDSLYTVIEIARGLEQSGRNISGPFSGQLRAYFIPWMEAWINDTNQPGSVASLRRIANGE